MMRLTPDTFCPTQPLPQSEPEAPPSSFAATENDTDVSGVFAVRYGLCPKSNFPLLQDEEGGVSASVGAVTPDHEVSGFRERLVCF